MAILTRGERQQRLQNTQHENIPHQVAIKDGPQVCSSDRIADAYQALNYNQQLIQFADSKAGNLIVINSLFVAAAQAQVKVGWFAKGSQSLMVLLAGIAVVSCLSVITSKIPSESKFSGSRKADLLFFSDILSRSSPEGYHRDVAGSSNGLILQEVTRRTYALASIAASKYKMYSRAQALTVWAAYLWVFSQVVGLAYN